MALPLTEVPRRDDYPYKVDLPLVLIPVTLPLVRFENRQELGSERDRVYVSH